MDDALRRTRRNMIGTSVVLFLIYLVDGQFPRQLLIFNYEIPLSAIAIQWLIWIFLIYMCIEYYVHVKSKFPNFSKAYWVHLMALLAPYVENRLTDDDRKKIAEYLETLTKEPRFENLSVAFREILSGTLYVDSRIICTTAPDFERQQSGGARISSEIPLSAIRPYRIRAALRVAITEDKGFEYILPVIYPLAAVVMLTYREAGTVIALLIRAAGD